MRTKNLPSYTFDLNKLLRPSLRYSDGLPILERRDEIVNAIKNNQVIIVAGETGSGKTTQLPVMCLEAMRGTRGKIGCTQPRRIAATSIAFRVAQELNCTLGHEVGYKIRFNDLDSAHTAIKFMTDGILLTEIERDPLLRLYDTLIIDEAHERSLNIDFILGYLRKLLSRRPDLKIIISSATIDTALFSKAFFNAPVIEVSGRMFPVEVLYLDPVEDEKEDDVYDYINASVKAAQDLIDLYGCGDMLIFMPAERDIRETCDKLRGLHLNDTLILPLFSRLSRAEQDLIFKPAGLRKIVVATNIAETSITVPGIRFVIDTGLARISRYIPRLRTNRLPIEPVSRAAAEQRKGRCGRVMDGVCVRLYTEKDFLGREQFTLPEIKRSNLAGVVLSMIAHKLGNIEEFPFLEPPSKQAISEAYAQLRELGALDAQNNLTQTGREMSFLPLDPHIARMVLAARQENALREIKIIASALSIVDPRERPFDKQAEADAMHKKFQDPGSDFVLYVNLWDAYQHEWQTLKTQNRMRKFCKDHFLSFVRMQEWHDVHQQLDDTIKNMRGFINNPHPADYESIHRALLTGLLSNCAIKSENGRYTAARGREVLIFPGSSIAGKGVEWIVCHEIFETSQVFARTVAMIKPKWLEDVGSHLCTRSYSEPFFDKETGAVKADEYVSLFGLPVTVHKGIRYGRINISRATDVFIWCGLVEEQLECHHPFYINNKRIKKEIETKEAKLRTKTLFAGEQAVAEFYKKRIQNISSVHELNKLIKETEDHDAFLFMSEDDLLAASLPEETRNYPDKVSIGGKNFPLKYAFKPGEDDDGVTITIPQKDAPFIPADSIGWLLPPLWPERIAELLQGLPKDIRKKLMPVNDKAREIASVLKVSNEPFSTSVADAIGILYGIKVDAGQLTEEKISPHLSLRIELRDEKGNIVTAGRGGTVLSEQEKMNTGFSRNSLWEKAFAEHEKHNVTDWNFGDLPDSIEIISSEKGIPIYGYPALLADTDCVHLIMARSHDEALQIHYEGVRHLLEIVIGPEFGWIERDIRFTQNIKLLCTPLGGADKIKSILLSSIRKHLLTIPYPAPVKKSNFEVLVNQVKKQCKSIGFEALTLLEKFMTLHNENVIRIKKEPRASLGEIRKRLEEDLKKYTNEFIENKITFEEFRQYPRYLKAFGYRIERAFNDPSKYNEKMNQLRIYIEKFSSLQEYCKDEKCKQLANQLKSMIEEFGISLFAQQEVKTLFPVSIQRLDKKIDEVSVAIKAH